MPMFGSLERSFFARITLNDGQGISVIIAECSYARLCGLYLNLENDDRDQHHPQRLPCSRISTCEKWCPLYSTHPALALTFSIVKSAGFHGKLASTDVIQCRGTRLQCRQEAGQPLSSKDIAVVPDPKVKQGINAGNMYLYMAVACRRLESSAAISSGACQLIVQELCGEVLRRGSI